MIVGDFAGLDSNKATTATVDGQIYLSTDTSVLYKNVIGLFEAIVTVSGERYCTLTGSVFYENMLGVWTEIIPNALDLRDQFSEKVKREIQLLAPTALVELFELDMSTEGAGSVFFHSGTNAVSGDIVWKGVGYNHLPVETEGFAAGSTGTSPRPKVRVANIDNMFGSTIETLNDLQDCRLIRRRTFARYLDAVNFPNSENPYADQHQHFPDDIWYVDQKVSENRYIIEWELASPSDLTNVTLPSRTVNRNNCSWRYKGVDCGYDPTTEPTIPLPNKFYQQYYTLMDEPTANPTLDVCGKRLSSCEKRWTKNGTITDAILPFGGFPGAVVYE